ncbi:MAG: tyrosine-type recombinase/integrase, partial [Acidobacteriales bacterium]|nr:tyrosine-type recombinase/integrase [Terriglobales bacterium]
VLLYSLSATSKRQYQHTFKLWAQFASDNGFHPLELTPTHIIAFLDSHALAHRTKTARLSHLRKLLATLHAQQPDTVTIEALYKQVQLLKVKRDEETQTADRDKHALKPAQIHKALAVWRADTRLHRRNRALLAVLFYAGLRRSEAAALQWRDIDLEAGVIHVRHGKGDKERTVPILSDTLTADLQQWRSCVENRVYVFCGIRKGDHLDSDKPMITNSIWKVVKATGEAIGIANLAPHDARRTLLTNALQAGANVADAQFIAGHANPQTTLGYAVVKDAKEVAGRVKLNY